MRFRQGEVAVIADIDALQSQDASAVPRLPLISVVARQRWLSQDPIGYQMCVYILEPRHPLVVQTLR